MDALVASTAAARTSQASATRSAWTPRDLPRAATRGARRVGRRLIASCFARRPSRLEGRHGQGQGAEGALPVDVDAGPGHRLLALGPAAELGVPVGQEGVDGVPAEGLALGQEVPSVRQARLAPGAASGVEDRLGDLGGRVGGLARGAAAVGVFEQDQAGAVARDHVGELVR